MAIHSEWDNPTHTTLLTTHRSAWTWAEYERHERDTIVPMLARVDQRVNRIIDLRQSHWLQPMRFKDQIQRSIELLGPFDIATTIFVVKDRSIGALLEVAFQQFGQDECTYKTVSTMESARAYITQKCTQPDNCESKIGASV